MNLGQFTSPTLLIPRLVSQWRDCAVSELSQHLENSGRIASASAFTRAVLDHESLASAVFDEVAFPLGREQGVKRLSFALGLSEQGIRWGTGRTPAVSAVVLFVVPLLEGQHFLSLVLTFSRFLRDEKAFSALRRCTQPKEMWSALSRVRWVHSGPVAELAQE